MLFATVETSRLLWAAGAVVAYATMCVYIWQRQRQRQASDTIHDDSILLGWASQSGNAQSIAENLAQQLQLAGNAVLCLPLERISTTQLKHCRTQLYIASTYDDGLSPEHARKFIHRLQQVRLDHTNIQVLGLGDRRYPNFCRFAQQLQQTLQERGAKKAAPLIKVDNMRQQDLDNWQTSLSQRFNLQHSNDAAKCQQAKLIQRTHLNPNSSSAGLYLLQFAVKGGSWQPGDTIRVRPFNDPQLSAREYSIASAPGDLLELVVRSAGQCSNWLCTELALKENLDFMPVAKPNFHDLNPDAPGIFIGAGSGIAGLRGHILSRSSQRNWLIFGERSPEHDHILQQEGAQWLASGHVQQIDYAFSRDADNPGYVQNCLEQQQVQLHEWIANGAMIFLCGSQQGMGRSVLQQLEQILGSNTLAQLRQQKRLLTDLY